MAASVDAKLLKSTKFPPEFNQKVDMKKVNIEVMKKWIAGQISMILGDDDDVVIELCFNLLEGSRFPNIKNLQIQLTGFLEKDTPKFCQDLWKLCISAQENPQGVPKDLLEAKKQELKQEKLDAARAADEAKQRRDNDFARERDVHQIRTREREERGGHFDRGFRGDGGRGRGRGSYGRDIRNHSPPRSSERRSRSPLRRYDRGRDSYGASRGGRGRFEDVTRRPRRRSRSASPARPARHNRRSRSASEHSRSTSSTSPGRQRRRRNTSSGQSRSVSPYTRHDYGRRPQSPARRPRRRRSRSRSSSSDRDRSISPPSRRRSRSSRRKKRRNTSSASSSRSPRRRQASTEARTRRRARSSVSHSRSRSRSRNRSRAHDSERSRSNSPASSHGSDRRANTARKEISSHTNSNNGRHQSRRSRSSPSRSPSQSRSRSRSRSRSHSVSPSRSPGKEAPKKRRRSLERYEPRSKRRVGSVTE